MLSRWHIFGQHLAKMTHLLASHIYTFGLSSVLLNVTSFGCTLPRWPFSKWLCHNLARHVCCQDDTSLGSILPRWPAFWQVIHLVCHVCCQDDTLLDCILPSCDMLHLTSFFKLRCYMTLILMYLFQGLFIDTMRVVDVSLMMTNQGERKLPLKLRSNRRGEAFRRRYAGHWYVCW